MELRELIGWSSAFILLPTFVVQTYRQWRSRDEPVPAIMLWFFILALLGTAGQLGYAWMLQKWVYIVLNACLVINNTIGLALAVRRRVQHPAAALPRG